MHTPETLSFKSAMYLLETAEDELIRSDNAVHVAVHDCDQQFVQGKASLQADFALRQLTDYFGWGTTLGTAPPEYIFRHGEGVGWADELSLLRSNGTLLLRAEYKIVPETAIRVSYIAVKAGEVVIAQTMISSIAQIGEQQVNEQYGIISGNGR